MNTDRWASVLLGLTLLSWGARAAETATVIKDKVNVRGQASMKGEVVTQLSKGESVVVLEEIAAKNSKKGEPSKWSKIQLPGNSTVWVFAPYITGDTKSVNVSRVNVRSGRGENFSVLGRLDRGAVVKEVRTVDNWMEIEAPTNAYAFVATEYLEKAVSTATAPPPSEPAAAPSTTVTPPVAVPPTTVQTVATEPAPAAPAEETKPAPVVSEPVTQTQPEPQEPVVTTGAPAAPANGISTVAQVEPAPEPPPAPRRVVIREGRVVYSRSIQAPTTYALESLETHRLINYLHTEAEGLKLKSFAGRKVVVTGEELMDARWAYTPILEVQDIRIAR